MVNLKCVVVLGFYVGNVMLLGVNIVGVDLWFKMNFCFEKKLKGVEEVLDENLEKIIKLKFDLIIGLFIIKNVDKLKKIVFIVMYIYDKVDYFI